jgi:hypothetical protein
MLSVESQSVGRQVPRLKLTNPTNEPSTLLAQDIASARSES